MQKKYITSRPRDSRTTKTVATIVTPDTTIPLIMEAKIILITIQYPIKHITITTKTTNIESTEI